jgi:hypothetical protein
LSRYLAIDTDAGGLLVVSGFAKGDTVHTEQVLALFDDPRPLSSATAQDLGRRLKAALQEHRIAPAPVLLCLGRDRIIFKEIKHPKTAPADEPAIVKFQAQRELTELPEDVHMDYVPVPTKGDEERKATVVFVRKDLYNAAKEFCEEAGLKLAGVMPRPFAAVAAAREAVAASIVPPIDDIQHGSVAILSIWDGGGEFVVTHHDRLAFSRTVSANALSSETAFIGEAKRSMAAYAAQNPKSPIQAIYLAEGHSGGSWSARLQSALPIPVYPFDPLHAAPKNAVAPHLRGRFVGPIGMIAARGHGPLPINFVSPRQPRSEPNRLRSRFILAAILLVGIAGLLAAGSWFLNTEFTRQIEEQTKVKKQVENELKDLQTDSAKLAAVEDFRSRDICWLDVLYDIVVLYPDVDIMRLKEFEAKIPDPKVEPKTQTAAPKPALPGLPGQKIAIVPPKPAPKKAAGILTLILAAPDVKAIGVLEKQMIMDDKAYRNPQLGFGTTSGKIQEFKIVTEVFKKKPSEFTKKLIAKFPELPKKTDSAADADKENK